MISSNVIIFCTAIYLGVLFYIAYRGDKEASDRHSAYQPLIYTLSITIYCTSWTYFGAVGNAVLSGWDYFSIYLGPILVFLFFTPFLRKLIAVSKRQKTTTIADFIATRYGKSHRVAAIVSVIALIGTLPYISLQIKAVVSSYEKLTVSSAVDNTVFWLPDTALVLSVILAIFAILFGARTIDATEHHHGMIRAIAFESVIKIVAFMAVAILATSMIFDISVNSNSAPGPMAIMLSPFQQWELTPAFVTRTLLAATAIILLPRQFHVMAVEGRGDEMTVARWGLPVYLLIFSVAVIPIVAAGIQVFESTDSADLFVLSLPMAQGNNWLAIVSYIGGFSAATGMVIVAAITLSTMVSNDLIFPLILRNLKADIGQDFSRTLLIVRRGTILTLMLLAYGYYQIAAANKPLYSIGLLSFAAAVQFLPAIIGGLYWRNGHRDGAFWGLSAGFSVWLYTLLIPSFTDAADLTRLAVSDDGFSILPWLDPHALFGIEFSDYLTHGVFWSLFSNIFLYVVFSIRARQTFTDKLQASAYVDQTEDKTERITQARVSFRKQDIFELCGRFTGEDRARHYFAEHGYDPDHALTQQADSRIIKLAEHLLASSIGSATAKNIMRSATSSNSDDSLYQLLGEAGDALKFNREILQVTIDNISQGVSVVDQDLCLVAWNKSYVDLFEYPRGFLAIGKPIETVMRFNVERGLGSIAKDKQNDEISKRLSHLRHGAPYTFVRYWQDGRVIQTSGARLPEGGFITTFTDISQLKEVEQKLEATNLGLERKVKERTEIISRVNAELQQAKQNAEDATRSKSHFMAAASHDLIQPLSASRLYMSALLEDLTTDNDQDKENLAKGALSALTTAESLLKSLLDISKLDSGGLKPNITRFPLQHILTAIDNEFSVLAAEKGLRFRVSPTQLGAESDVALLRSVLLNFVSNAIRYTEEGTVMVACRRRGEHTRIEIRDSGIGIPEDKSAIIFDEFRQLDESIEGAGLGLAICQRMAQLLDHEINMVSKLGQGSCFSIDVPRCTVDVVETTGDVVKVHQKRWLQGVRILCVDDDKEILAALDTVLERWGGKVTCLQDASLFDECVASNPAFDVVLMDYQLNEGYKGLDLLKNYHQYDNDFLGVIITAEQEQQIEFDALSLGFKYLAKPVEPAKLRATLQAAFMDRKLAAEAGP